MTETHVVSALRSKRAEVSGYIHDLEKKVRHQRANLAHIDAAIRIFSPHTDPDTIPSRRSYRRSRYFSAGEVTRLCRGILREATSPVPAAAIAEALIAAKGLPAGDEVLTRHVTDGVLTVMRTLAKRGAVVKSGVSRDAHWSLAKESAE
jgi:hypothetical protein